MARLRASIDERPARWRRVLGDPAFCRTWLPQGKKKEEQTAAAAKRAFAAQNQDNALKTKPKVGGPVPGWLARRHRALTRRRCGLNAGL